MQNRQKIYKRVFFTPIGNYFFESLPAVNVPKKDHNEGSPFIFSRNRNIFFQANPIWNKK